MSNPFLYLADSIKNADEAQEVRLRLIQEQPAQLDDAKRIVGRVSHTAANQARKQPLQFYTTPTGDTLEPVQDHHTPSLVGIHDAISQLPESERELVNLRYIEGMTVSAIATHLRRDYKTTHTQMKTAVDKLLILMAR